MRASPSAAKPAQARLLCRKAGIGSPFVAISEMMTQRRAHAGFAASGEPLIKSESPTLRVTYFFGGGSLAGGGGQTSSISKPESSAAAFHACPKAVL